MSELSYRTEDVLARIEGKLDSRLDRMESNLTSRLDKLESQIQKLDEKVERKFEGVENRLNSLEIGQAEIKGEIKAIDKRLEKVETTQNKQVWALITLVAGAVLSILAGVIVAAWRIFFVPSP